MSSGNIPGTQWPRISQCGSLDILKWDIIEELNHCSLPPAPASLFHGSSKREALSSARLGSARLGSARTAGAGDRLAHSNYSGKETALKHPPSPSSRTKDQPNWSELSRFLPRPPSLKRCECTNVWLCLQGRASKVHEHDTHTHTYSKHCIRCIGNVAVVLHSS